MKTCPKCGSEHSKTGTFCSRSCANSRGPRTEEFKKTVSEKLTGRKQSLERRLLISGSNNRSWKGGKTQEKIKKCQFCDNDFSTKIEKVKFCSKTCWQNYCSDTKTDKEQYRSNCKFTFNIYEFPDKFDLSLIEKYGLYSAKNRGGNQQGVQRDHMYSISDGFANNIDPKIIAHPANCLLLCNFENQRKHAKSSITINELLERIKNW